MGDEADDQGSGWLRDLLLESPVPPSNWMPTRAERLADARDTLRRRFGQKRETSSRPVHRMSDLGSAHPLYPATRSVPGEMIEADMEADITSVNPPVVQGWAVGLFGVMFLVVLAGLVAIAQASDVAGLAVGMAAILGAPAAWVLALGVWGLSQRAIALDSNGVRVRRWTDVWLGRPGRRIGSPKQVRARLDRPNGLVIQGPLGTASLGLWTWPMSARADLVDELPIWGVDCDFGQHQHRHRRRARRPRRRP